MITSVHSLYNAANLAYFCLTMLNERFMKDSFLFFSLVVLFAACSESKPEQDLTIVPLKDTASNSVINTSATSNQNLSQQMPANPVNGLTQTQTTIPQSVTTAASSIGMNLEHGKPGHRCDIAVGAPLNSAPTKLAAPTTITQPTTDRKSTRLNSSHVD